MAPVLTLQYMEFTSVQIRQVRLVPQVAQEGVLVQHLHFHFHLNALITHLEHNITFM